MAAGKVQASLVRAGEHRVKVFNSGLEVWLYDEDHLATLRQAQPLSDDTSQTSLETLIGSGLLLGYGLRQDDALDILVIAGGGLTEQELAAAEWLEPRTAFLSLPSGRLCIESNDAARFRSDAPTDPGARVEIPAGDYRVTLHRVDHEALSRRGREWVGPAEVVVLTAGGTAADAAPGVLPYEPRRSLDWVGRYGVDGATASCLVWFDNYWDTFKINLDSAGAAALGLTPGGYVRLDVDTPALSFVVAFGATWTDGANIPPPVGADLPEFGYGAMARLGEWGGADALVCRRVQTTTVVDDEHQKQWLPARLTRMEVQARGLSRSARDDALFSSEVRSYAPANAGEFSFFPPGMLGFVLSDLLPGADDEEEFSFEDALAGFDVALAAHGFRPLGDFTYDEVGHFGNTPYACRAYGGHSLCSAVIRACEGSFEVFFLSSSRDGRWVVTGLIDQIEPLLRARPDVFDAEAQDDEVGAVLEGHLDRLSDLERDVESPPADLGALLETYEHFLAAAG